MAISFIDDRPVPIGKTVRNSGPESAVLYADLFNDLADIVKMGLYPVH